MMKTNYFNPSSTDRWVAEKKYIDEQINLARQNDRTYIGFLVGLNVGVILAVLGAASFSLSQRHYNLPELSSNIGQMQSQSPSTITERPIIETSFK
jgi:hypothetical protein